MRQSLLLCGDGAALQMTVAELLCLLITRPDSELK